MSNDNPVLAVYEANLTLALRLGHLMNVVNRQWLCTARLAMGDHHNECACEIDDAMRDWQQATTEVVGAVVDTSPFMNAWSEAVKQMMVPPALAPRQ